METEIELKFFVLPSVVKEIQNKMSTYNVL